jgi:YD repeat-containing protein
LVGLGVAGIVSIAPPASGAVGAGTAQSPAPETGTSLASATNAVRELPGLRTADSDTYLQSDGSRLLKISANPINYKVAGAWRPIDDTLQSGSDGSSHPAASPTPVNFPASLGSGPVTIGPADQQVSFSLQGASAVGTAAGTQQSYLGALPGVNVSYATSSQSVRETLTLTSASAPTTYRYALSLSSGLKASLSPGGGVAIHDALSGKLVYSLATPSVDDSSGKAHLPWTAPVHYELSSDGSVLTLVLDKAWLDDPARVFPVKIDPDVYFGGYQDCSIASQSYANTSLCNERLFVGANTESPKSVARALEQFDISSIPKGSTILSSSLALWFEATTTSSPIEIEAYALSQGFTQNVTWNTYDGTHAWSTPGGDHLKTEAGSQVIKPEYTGGWTSYGFTPEVEQWVRDPTSNHGILLKAHGETATGYDTFVQTGNGEGKPEPNLNVVYEPQLGIPGNGQVVEHAIGNGGVVSVNVTNGNLNVSDPDVNYATEGYATTVAREYNNRDDERVGSSFGDGWRLNMGEDELLYPAWWDGSNVLHQPDGSYTRFDRAPWADGHPAAGDEAYTGEAYVPATLTLHENDTRSVTYNNTGVEWQYDNSENGFPQKIVEPGGEGNTISLSYTSSHLTKITDTHSHSLTLTRESSTHHITKIKATGEEWKYGYDSSHRLISYKGPGGQEAEYGYTSGEEVLHYIKDPTGTLVFSYDEQDRVSSMRKIVNGTISTPGSEDETTSFSYETEQTTVTNPLGSESLYYYDQFGNALEEPATQEAAAEFYAGYAEIETEAARKDVDLQDHASILDSQLSQQLGANYTGEWFDPSTKRIKVGLTSEGFEQTVEHDLDALGLADNADIVTESASWGQLVAAEEVIATSLSTLVNEGLVVVEIQPNLNAVTIEKANSLTVSQAKEVTEAAAAATVSVHVIEASTPSVAAQLDACGGGACNKPLRGGVGIEAEAGSTIWHCTSGFVARSNSDNKPYVLTAGHCIKDAAVGTTWWSDTHEPLEAHNIGKAHSYFFGSSNNVSGGTTEKGDAGLIAIESGSFWANPLEPIVIVYGSSEAGTTLNERYGIIGTKYNPQASTPRLQFVVCSGGYGLNSKGEGAFHQEEACGITQGFIGRLAYAKSETVSNLEAVNVCNSHVHELRLGPGSSGSPVYKNHFAYGIHSGHKGECVFVYEGINTAESVLHVHVVTE